MTEPGVGNNRQIPAAFRSATEAQPHAPLGSDEQIGADGHQSPHAGDPLRLCVATTVALIAWLLTPPVAVAVFAALAVIAYGRARRAGVLRSRCVLGDTRVVLAYLSAALIAGIVGVVVGLT